MNQHDLDFPCSQTFRELPPEQRHSQKKTTLPKAGHIAWEDDFPAIHAAALALIGPGK